MHCNPRRAPERSENTPQLAAIGWGELFYFGTSIGDVKKLGFSELTISNKEMKRKAKLRIKIVSGVEKDACLKLLEEWKKTKNNPY